LIEEMDSPNHKSRLSIFVVFAAVVADSHVAFQVHDPLIRRERAHVKGPPGQTAGEVGQLERHLAVDLGTNQPPAKLS
jgi:hypothetical protein